MKIVKRISQMNRLSAKAKQNGQSIGFVPTLGALHRGHATLIKHARKQNDIVVVSCFVNRPQFRAKAYKAYPRNHKQDADICVNLGVDYLFAPSHDEMYPAGFDTKVEVVDLVGRLEGKSIRWHYRAVATVVAKLFNIVDPDRAYFGKKDPHQLAILRRTTADLDFPVKIVAVNAVRDRDGLALSSRNELLDPAARQTALVIPQAINEVAQKISEGIRERTRLSDFLRVEIEKEPTATVDFATVVDSKTLREEDFGGDSLIYVAVYIGDVRLTDQRVVRAIKKD